MYVYIYIYIYTCLLENKVLSSENSVHSSLFVKILFCERSALAAKLFCLDCSV